MSTTRTPVTRTVSVRLPAATATGLDALAAASDRTRTQLIRYAITALEHDPTPITVDDTATSAHVVVRLPHAMIEQITLRAGADQVTVSAVLRAAIDRWLGSEQTTRLGSAQVTR